MKLHSKLLSNAGFFSLLLIFTFFLGHTDQSVNVRREYSPYRQSASKDIPNVIAKSNTFLSAHEPQSSQLPQSVPALAYPPDPVGDISWSAGTNGVADIQAAFNNARALENTQLGKAIPMMTLPSQAEWNSMNNGQKALWLINRERIDRGVLPLHGLESNVNDVAQYYADYLLDNNAWGHDADGLSPWERLDANPAIGACHDFLSISENIAVFVTSGSSIPLPIERSIFMWIYEDGDCCGWGHRHAILWYPYNNNSGPTGDEGFLGIGRANGGPYQGPFSEPWPYAEMIVMNVFDPCSTWAYSIPQVASITRADPNPTNASSVDFTVTFSEAVSGVNKSDFILTTTGIPGASLSTVSGSGTTYNVSVKIDSCSGTIRLDVNDNDTIKNSSGTALGGAGMHNGDFTTGDVYTVERPSNVDVLIAGSKQGCYFLEPGASTRKNYTGLDSGPVKVVSTSGTPIIAALRDSWYDSTTSTWTSFVQMMGLPKEQLSDTYYFPSYNNVSLSGQLRFGNVDTVGTWVRVVIGGVERGRYYLDPSEQARVEYDLDSGPVVIESETAGVKIIAALRDAWWDGVRWTSFSQMMGLPKESLSDSYYFPSYNNVSLSGQLRFGNVDTVGTWVRVVIGGVERGRYYLDPSEQQRVEYDLDSGPVVIESETPGVKIIAALRDAWYDGVSWTSFVQMMGLPKEQLADTYYLPAYNNVSLSGQLRFGNVDTVGTWMRVVIGGVQRGRYYLDPSEQVRVEYNLDSGPVVIESETAGVKIIAALRDAWYDGVRWTSFAQMMGLPVLSDTYYFPSYNNLTLDGQLRFGIP
jgi:hypothetical protein